LSTEEKDGMELATSSAPAASAEQPLELLLLGDCMLGRLVNEVLENAPPEYPWGDTLPILQGADWRLCNLECVISEHCWLHESMPFR